MKRLGAGSYTEWPYRIYLSGRVWILSRKLADDAVVEIIGGYALRREAVQAMTEDRADRRVRA